MLMHLFVVLAYADNDCKTVLLQKNVIALIGACVDIYSVCL